MQGRSSDLRRAVLSVDLPRLRLQDPSADLTQVQSSIAVSVFSSRGNAVYAVLEANFHFEFGATGETTRNRTPVPNSFHAEILRLGRDNFYALLNAMGLTGVAVEIGVYTGDFAMRMLRNWRGNRFGRIVLFSFRRCHSNVLPNQICNGGSLAPLVRCGLSRREQ